MANKPVSRYPLDTLSDGKPRFSGCSKVQEYEWMCKLGEGTFGEVSKARSKKTGQVVALKKILVHNEKDGFPITSLREIRLLKAFNHPNVLRLIEMAVERPRDVTKKSHMFMVTPYMDHDLSGILKNPNIHLTIPQIKCYMKQLLEGCKYLHESRVLHRDMKAANLLISNAGILQIADFGLARPYDDPPPQPGKGGGEATRGYTAIVVTRWYRPPELLLQLKNYTTAVDMWGVGCVFGEMFKKRPILQGDSDLAQTQMIFSLLGAPTNETMPGWEELPGCEGIKDWGNKRSTLRHNFAADLGPVGFSLLEELLKLDWRMRINAIDALEHPYFKTDPLPARPGDLPIMESSHEYDKQKQREERRPPPAPAGGQVGIGPQNEYGFQDRSRPHDRHGARGGRPRHNGPDRRPPHYPPNGDYDHRAPRPPRNDNYDHGYRPPRDYDDPYERDRRRPPPPPQGYDDPYMRRPVPPPDTSLPPRPPMPADVDRFNGVPPPYRDRDERPPPRRIPPGTSVEDPRAPIRQPEVDTYIPPYSSADPSQRPPRGVLREANPVPVGARRPPPPPRDGSDRPTMHGGRGRSVEYDEMLPYDDANGDVYARSRGPSSVGSYERRRSRSPMRDRIPARERDRPYYHDRDVRNGAGHPYHLQR
ncbi:serine/threonine protein kinase, CMGC, CDC2/CDK subfamily [Lithohypha guttulata]|nr:serine/threonine protein kinase, CMGC, CDC2/CDK subfamily [Lithohypha guttulata]